VYDEQRQLFADPTQQDPTRFINLGDSNPDKLLKPDKLAALTVMCQVILNLDATVFER
jgi:hypothetical protein